MTRDQLELMFIAARQAKEQRRLAEQAALDMIQSGRSSSAPEGISDSRWRGMLVRILMDQKSGTS